MTRTIVADGTRSVADLHYSVGTGSCRDTDKALCTGDPDTQRWLGDALDAEKPDLVVSCNNSIRQWRADIALIGVLWGST